MSSGMHEVRQPPAGFGTDRDVVALDARQERALCALLTARSVEEAAKRSRVGVRTLYRWLAESETFGNAYRETIMGMRMAIVARVSAASLDAVAVLHEIATDQQLRPHERMAAASHILEAAGTLGDISVDRATADSTRTVLCYPVPMPVGAEPPTRAQQDASDVPGFQSSAAHATNRIRLDHQPPHSASAGGRHG